MLKLGTCRHGSERAYRLGSSVVERSLGKTEVAGPIPASGSHKKRRSLSRIVLNYFQIIPPYISR